MADTNTWMPLYVADYLKDTGHISTVEHGAYFLLIMHAWTHGGRLPLDPERLRRITGMTPKEWKSSWPVLAEFFTSDEIGYRHKRIDAELARAADITEKRRAAANASWEKRKGLKRNANASANALQPDMQNDCIADDLHSHSHSHIEEDQNTTPPLLHRALAFGGEIVRVNQRDFDAWEKTYHGIPDLRATLASLDEWVKSCASTDHTVSKRWRQMVTAQLDRKHQAFIAEIRRGDEWEFTSPC